MPNCGIGNTRKEFQLACAGICRNSSTPYEVQQHHLAATAEGAAIHSSNINVQQRHKKQADLIDIKTCAHSSSHMQKMRHAITALNTGSNSSNIQK